MGDFEWDFQLLSSSDILDLKYRNGTATLSINEVYPEDEGTYTCTAKNSLGVSETTCRLTIQSKLFILLFYYTFSSQLDKHDCWYVSQLPRKLVTDQRAKTVRQES